MVHQSKFVLAKLDEKGGLLGLLIPSSLYTPDPSWSIPPGPCQHYAQG